MLTKYNDDTLYLLHLPCLPVPQKLSIGSSQSKSQFCLATLLYIPIGSTLTLKENEIVSPSTIHFKNNYPSTDGNNRVHSTYL